MSRTNHECEYEGCQNKCYPRNVFCDKHRGLLNSKRGASRCLMEGCGIREHARGLCSKHYGQWYSGKLTPPWLQGAHRPWMDAVVKGARSYSHPHPHGQGTFVIETTGEGGTTVTVKGSGWISMSGDTITIKMEEK